MNCIHVRCRWSAAGRTYYVVQIHKLAIPESSTPWMCVYKAVLLPGPFGWTRWSLNGMARGWQHDIKAYTGIYLISTPNPLYKLINPTGMSLVNVGSQVDNGGSQGNRTGPRFFVWQTKTQNYSHQSLSVAGWGWYVGFINRNVLHWTVTGNIINEPAMAWIEFWY